MTAESSEGQGGGQTQSSLPTAACAARRGKAAPWSNMRCDQTIPNLLLKSCVGFVGGTLLTYLCFVFTVCQLSMAALPATLMSSMIGLVLTLGLAFSNRMRCLVLLLIPQLFSRIGRYTLTCYALVLILTGPATSSLRNSEVLTESMACSQEQVNSFVRHLSDSAHHPLNALKAGLPPLTQSLDGLNAKLSRVLHSIERMVVGIADVIQSSYYWLTSVMDMCNLKLDTPYEHCKNVLTRGLPNCKSTLGSKLYWLCNVTTVESACQAVKSYKKLCMVDDSAKISFAATLKRKLRHFTDRMKAMFHVRIEARHRYGPGRRAASRAARRVAAGVVTEMRSRADPLIAWLSWSSCLAGLFLLLIVFRAKYYQHMYETRSRFDNRYVTKDLYEIDRKRLREGRAAVLPLNRRETTKYVPTTSFRLIASEKAFVSRSAVVMMITTFKLTIHMVADYSLFWVLTTIKHHGRHGHVTPPGPSDAGVTGTGSGLGAEVLTSILSALTLPLRSPAPPAPCLPHPPLPDFGRYSQISGLIVVLWLLALFEPYGLRLRHVVMGQHRPERAKARASWLCNHILRTRVSLSKCGKSACRPAPDTFRILLEGTGGPTAFPAVHSCAVRSSFMKLARRKLHREYKYYGRGHVTFREWLDSHLPCYWLRYLFGTLPKRLHCLLCETVETPKDIDTQLSRCESPGCPGVFCRPCFADVGQLCTICMSPADYGDYSDISLEKGSDEESDEDYNTNECKEDSSKGYIQLQMTKMFHNKSKHYDRKYKENKPIYNSKIINNCQKTRLLTDTEVEIKNEPELIAECLKQNLCNDHSSGIRVNNFFLINLLNSDRRRRNSLRLRVYKKEILQKFKNRKFLKTRAKYYNIRRISWKSEKQWMRRIYTIMLKSFVPVHWTRHLSKCFSKTRSGETGRKRSLKYTYYPAKIKRKMFNTKFSSFRRCLVNHRQNKSTAIKASKKINQFGQKFTVRGNSCLKDTASNKNDTGKKKKMERKAKKGRIDSTNANKDRSLYARTMRVAFATCLNLNCNRPNDEENERINQDCLDGKDTRNFKKRKKKKNADLRLQNESSRDYRISAYLQEQSWVNGLLRKDSFKERTRRECALNQLAECRLYAATNRTREEKLLKTIGETINIRTKICCCPHGVCICQGDKPQSKCPKQEKIENVSDAKIKSKCCKSTRKECAGKNEESKRMKLLKLCRGKKYCCKVEHIQREEETSSSFWRESGLIGVHEDEEEREMNRSDAAFEVAAKPPKRLDFYRSMGNEFNTIGQSLSNEECHEFEKSTSETTTAMRKNNLDETNKCLRIKDLKMILSDRFLHLRIKNPAPLIRDFYTHVARLSDRNKGGNKNTVNLNKETSEKGVTVLPLLRTRSCQCLATTLVQDRGTQMRRQKGAAPFTIKFAPKKSRPRDSGERCQQAAATTSRRLCSCATQYGPVGDNRACNLTSKSKSETVDRNLNSNEESFSNSSSFRCSSSDFDDDKKADTTICSHLQVDYVEERPRKATVRRVRKIKVDVTTKTNQGTSTDKTTLCDVSTLTEDWWSPLNERKPVKEEAGDHRRGRKSKGVATDRRFVKFLSRAQIIPRDTCDILSPSRYLLESQKYYNELFSSKFFAPHVFTTLNAKGKESGKYLSKRSNTRKSKATRLDEPARSKIVKLQTKFYRYRFFMNVL